MVEWGSCRLKINTAINIRNKPNNLEGCLWTWLSGCECIGDFVSLFKLSRFEVFVVCLDRVWLDLMGFDCILYVVFNILCNAGRYYWWWGRRHDGGMVG